MRSSFLSSAFLVLFVIVVSGNIFSLQAAVSTDPDPEKMKANIQELTEYFEEKGYAFKTLLDDPRFELVERITKKFTNSAERKIETLSDYQKAIGYQRKINGIEAFIREYDEELDKAEKEYGISKYVIASILGVESEYGKYKGRYNPFSTYVSMYAEGHRSKFAKEQLEELLIFVKNNELDVFELESSYAGAMSHAQFIPSSLNRWFVGSDLYYMPNNIASVANYLKHFYDVTGSVEKAVFRYNPSSLYTQAVLTLAEEAEALMAASE